MAKVDIERYGSLAAHRGFLGLPPKSGSRAPFPCNARDVFERQARGLAKRLSAIGCRDVVVGLSGGLDSALALLVSVEAFRRLKLPISGIHAITMPCFGTSSRTRGNASLLCEGLGLKLEEIPIAGAVRRHLRDIGHDGRTPDVTYENAQARMRTLVLMDKANMVGGIVVGTGDMSEIALGWCTFNGDHMSMFGVNSGVPKTIVRKVCTWWAEESSRGSGARGRRGSGRGMAAKAILDIVATPVSPELVKGQKTEDAIGPYELHDFFLWNFIVNEMAPRDLAKAAEAHFKGRFTCEQIAATLKTFVTRLFTQSFKRNCQPDGVRVFSFDLSPRGWWIPSELKPVWRL